MIGGFFKDRSNWGSEDYVRIILSLCVLVVMVTIAVGTIVNGYNSDGEFSEIGITAMAGTLGAIIGALTATRPVRKNDPDDESVPDGRRVIEAGLETAELRKVSDDDNV